MRVSVITTNIPVSRFCPSSHKAGSHFPRSCLVGQLLESSCLEVRQQLQHLHNTWDLTNFLLGLTRPFGALHKRGMVQTNVPFPLSVCFSHHSPDECCACLANNQPARGTCLPSSFTYLHKKTTMQLATIDNGDEQGNKQHGEVRLILSPEYLPHQETCQLLRKVGTHELLH